MQLDIRQGIYLAALLHDIGKFWQRGADRWEPLSAHLKENWNDVCPPSGYDKNKPGYQHALFTSQFFDTYSDVIPTQVEENGKSYLLRDWSARHHKQDTGLDEFSRIIGFADKLSSGQDRRDDEETEEAAKGQYLFKKTPLVNIFDTLYGGRPTAERSYYPLKALDNSASVFPEAKQLPVENLPQHYAELWSQFEQEVRQLPQANYRALVTTLHHLLKKYTWSIPSATNAMPDISLYDHLSTTASIAACLYDSVGEHGALPETFGGILEGEKDKNRFILLAGDFSGIQKFIYQITSKGAAKTLKGRSFYLGLLQNQIITRILDIFDVQRGHVLMESGGRFQLLLPNIEEKAQLVKSEIERFNHRLNKAFDGVLYLAYGMKPFPAARLMDRTSDFGELVEETYDLVEQSKNSRFSESLDADFFQPRPIKGTKGAQICEVTGMDLDEDEVAKLDLDTEDTGLQEGAVRSKTVQEQIKLGRWLRNANYLLTYKGRGEQHPKEITPLQHIEEPAEYYPPITYAILSNADEDRDKLQKALHDPALVDIQLLNDFDFSGVMNRDAHYSIGTQFYGASWTPSPKIDEKNSKERPVEFTDIAEDGVNNDMAVLRLDVDNLGKIFKEGFDEEKGRGRGSISRYSTLSNMLDWFFAGYIDSLVTADFTMPGVYVADSNGQDEIPNKKPREHILPVYAGGDDVFIICRWDIAPLLARRIRDDFRRFTNYNENIGLSGGVSVVKGKYPIHKAAQEAETLEAEAKSLVDANGKPDGKNAFTLFDVPLDWQDLDKAQDLTERMITCQSEMENRALLGMLRSVLAEYAESGLYGRWRWRTAYRIARMSERHNKVSDELSRFAAELFNGSVNGDKPIRTDHNETIDLIPVVARWMQNLTRKG